jgi:hypothetical protein
MKKIFMALLMILFVFACSNDWSQKNKKAPAYKPITARDVR